MNYEKYLPVGTVVMLKGGTKRAMITGFCCMGDSNQKVYDYVGVLYPEGFLSSNKNLLFDHNQIEKIYFLGLQDEEEKKFKETLKKTVESFNFNKKMDNNNQDNNTVKEEKTKENELEIMDM